MDIDKGFGNANKIMNSLLKANHDIVKVAEINGGSLRNAIPRESFAIIACHADKVDQLKEHFEKQRQMITDEFAEKEPHLNCSLSETDRPSLVMSDKDQNQLFQALDKAINGVYSMSQEIEDLVESSNNIARVTVDKGNISIACLTRSSVETGKMEVANSLKETFEDNGFAVKFSGSYPGWSPNRDSPILKVLKGIYTDLFKSEPAVVACHAGLECGLLGTHYPDMDMISFGPTIKGAHSPDERASISSTIRFWAFLQLVLKNVPLKD